MATHANRRPASPAAGPGPGELLHGVASGVAGLGLVTVSFLGAIPGFLPGVLLAVLLGAVVVIPMLVVGVALGVVYGVLVLVARIVSRGVSAITVPGSLGAGRSRLRTRRPGDSARPALGGSGPNALVLESPRHDPLGVDADERPRARERLGAPAHLDRAGPPRVDAREVVDDDRRAA